jgi:hypothetical protein
MGVIMTKNANQNQNSNQYWERKGQMPELARVIKACIEHRDELLADDPWLPFPQNTCCFSFGEKGLPLPIGAAFFLWDQWPDFTGTCECGGAIYGYGFGGFLSMGGVPGVCVDCGARYFNQLGGFGTVGHLADEHLIGTPYKVKSGRFGGCFNGPRKPLVEKLKALGASDLPGDEWCEKDPPPAAILTVK